MVQTESGSPDTLPESILIWTHAEKAATQEALCSNGSFQQLLLNDPNGYRKPRLRQGSCAFNGTQGNWDRTFSSTTTMRVVTKVTFTYGP